MCQSNSGSARRRQFLKRSSVVTASVFSLGIGSKRTLAETANGEEVRYIKYLHGEPKNGGRKAIYDTIRFDEWARKSTAANVADRIERQILNRFGTVQVAVAFGVDEDSPTGFGVEIQYITRHRAGGETTEPSVDIDRLRREFEGFSKGIAKRNNKEEEKRVPVRVVKKNEKILVVVQYRDNKWINILSIMFLGV